ncbi:hypothetical protein FSW04_00220 [Baekduia soli]|uniref:Uncharacterized protein n=1 Tax=Baekduia soli TaxID=496014 RepID=A0A5B8TZJ1_9ACTN|nr:hypothetical protein [Baekduia soli]QEC46142.1 hypothetical protein FSW04_00220 [Baekduia soli]
MRTWRSFLTVTLAGPVLPSLVGTARAATLTLVPYGASYRHLGVANHESCADSDPPHVTFPAGTLHGGENHLAVRARDRGDRRSVDAQLEVALVDSDGDGYDVAVTPSPWAPGSAPRSPRRSPPTAVSRACGRSR